MNALLRTTIRSLWPGKVLARPPSPRAKQFAKRTADAPVRARQEPSAGEAFPTADAQGSAGSSPVAGGVLPCKPAPQELAWRCGRRDGTWAFAVWEGC